MNVELINLTPHTVNLMLEGDKVAIPQGGRPARVRLSDVAEQIMWSGHSVPVIVNTMGAVHGLPQPVDGTRFIVSRTVANALAGVRDDLLVPHGFVLNERRHVSACTSLMRLEHSGR